MIGKNGERIKMIEHRKMNREEKCTCGSDILFFNARWHCVEYVQKQLAETDYALFKKEN